MIDEELNLKEFNKHYNHLPIRTEINLICDYCNSKFKRIKKSRERLNKIISKDSCGCKNCKAKKKEEVNIKLYGTKNYFESKEFSKKSKKTNLEKYGTEDYFSSKDFKNKRSESLLQKYGVDSPLKNKKINEKQKETCLKRYGVENFSKTSDFIDKYKKTSNQNYGCDFPINSKKIKKYNKKKYGCDFHLASEKVKKKIVASYLEKYGETHPVKSQTIKNKIKKTNFEKYGFEYAAQSEEIKNKVKQTILKKYGYESTFQCPEIRKKIIENNIKKYGQERAKFGKTQESIRNWLNEYGYNFNSDHEILEGKELDLYDSDKKIAIEYCGLYWHNEGSPEPRNRKYHYYKYKKCKDNEIQLLTIFDDEWNNKQNIIKSVILSKLGLFSTRIYARKCVVKEIDKKSFGNFCDQYHIQGKNSLSLVCFGLFYNNELVGVIDLGRHHRKKEQESLVLTRLCFKEGYQIVGGSSKLLSACVAYCKKNNIKNIISWSDNRWSNGNIYKNLGFIWQEDLDPDYSYVNSKNPKKRLSKQSQKKSNTGCPKEISELDWAKSRGLSRIWDCGKTRWIYVI
jgi:predicted GNAT family N-acyltransferase